EAVEQVRVDDLARGLLEADRAHVVALAAGPHQFDVGGQVRAGDLHPARGEVGVEVPALGQPPADPRLAGLVGPVVEDLPGAGFEIGKVLGQVAVAVAGADDRHVRIAHAHRLARVDGDVHVHPAVGARLFDLDLGRVVAEG